MAKVERDFGTASGRLQFSGVLLSAALIAAGLLRAEERWLRAGIGVLIATPVANVALLGLGYGLRGRRGPAAAALGLLLLLALSAFLGGTR